MHVPHREGAEPDLEEGEIEDDPEAEVASLLGCDWTLDKQAHAWLALALFERLSGDGPRACEAAQKALTAAAGNQSVRLQCRGAHVDWCLRP